MTDLRTTVAQFLSSRGIRLNTDLGQHFLVDQDVLDAIVESADLKKTDHIVEIGPGIGVLTKELLPRVKTVTAIELDQRLIPLLQAYTNQSANSPLEIIPGNALQVSLPENPYKIVANIPYHITSPLLRHAFLESTVKPTSLTLLIQREVAEKIVDPDHAGLLTIMVALFGKATLVRHVPPECFLPPPEVDSAVLHIESYKQPLADTSTIDHVFWLSKMAFSQKRKMLRNTLGNTPEGAAHLEALGIDLTRRPETLSIDEWIALATEWFSGSKEPDAPQKKARKS